jgi:RsiW-degrading membrane proteinase PrsW (M82 family)
MGLFYIAILPVIVLLFDIYKKDVDKEPRGLLAKLFIFGAISVFPLCIIELVYGEFFSTDNLPTFTGTFVTVFLTVALVEEFGKWFITYLCTYRKREFNHPYDGLVYAVFASLGFAAVENIFYVLSSGVSTGIMRALLAVPGHAVDAVIMGYFLSKSKEALVKQDNGKSLLHLTLSILVPSITHAIYDGLIFHYTSTEEDYLIILFFAFVIVSYAIALIIINKLSKVKVNFDGTIVQPPQQVKPIVNNQQVINTPVQPVQISRCVNCGAPLNGDTCTNCGFKRG